MNPVQFQMLLNKMDDLSRQIKTLHEQVSQLSTPTNSAVVIERGVPDVYRIVGSGYHPPTDAVTISDREVK